MDYHDKSHGIGELKSLFGDKEPSYSTVINWFNEFNCERRSLKVICGEEQKIDFSEISGNFLYPPHGG